MSMLAPSETPVLSSADKFKCNGTFVEWGVDKLSTPSSTAVSEGADVTDFEAYMLMRGLPKEEYDRLNNLEHGEEIPE